MKLKQGMFRTKAVCEEFKLVDGQMRSHDMVHNGSWFNKAGEKIGWGDLNEHDFLRLQTLLDPDDVFVVVGEHDSFWDADRRGLDVNNLPPEYVAAQARYAITKHDVRYFPGRYDREQKAGSVVTLTGPSATVPCVAIVTERRWLCDQMGVA